MNATVTVTTLLYLAVTAGLGYLGFKQTTSAKDYLLAGRKVHPVIMAISYGSTFISTAAIVGFGGAAAVFGMGILWLTVLNIFLGIFIAFIVFGKPTRRMGHMLDAHTFPEFIGKQLQGFSTVMHQFHSMLLTTRQGIDALRQGTEFIPGWDEVQAFR